MSSSQVTPHLEAAIYKRPSTSLNPIAVDTYDGSPPSTEAYRSQQFVDFTDEPEGPPPYQDGVADTFILVHDSDHQLPLNLTRILELSDGFLHMEAEQSIITGDFILFQDEVLWADNAGDVISFDASSSQASCCSAISVCSSVGSSKATSASAFPEHQRSNLEELLQLDPDQACNKAESVDTGRLIHWLKNIMSPSNEDTPSPSLLSD